MLLFFFAILNYLEVQDKNVEATERIQNELTVTLSEQEDLTNDLQAAREMIAFYEEEFALCCSGNAFACLFLRRFCR